MPSANLFKQAFSKDLQKNLFPENEFYKNSKDDSSFIENDQVNLPHAGTIPGVTVDRTEKTDPTQRTDTATYYKVHEFSTDPTLIKFSEGLIVNYNKRASIVEEQGDAINTTFADFVANEWAATTGVIQVRTSGEARPATTAAATGNRKRITLKDVLASSKELNKQGVPQKGRFACITPDMLEDILLIPEAQNANFNADKPLVDGSIGYWMGFKWYIRERVNIFTNAATPVIKAIDAAGAATDNAAAIFWHKNLVRRAEGNNKAFLNLDDSVYQGDIVSALARGGASLARKDGKGIINLVEAAAA